MSLWVRHLAWLSATPKPHPDSQRAQMKGLELVSRMEKMRRQGISSPLMPPNSAPHLTGWLTEIGMSEAAGMTAAPVSWRTINAWCERTRIDLPPWQARLLRRLSADFLEESRLAESENRPPPWHPMMG